MHIFMRPSQHVRRAVNSNVNSNGTAEKTGEKMPQMAISGIISLTLRGNAWFMAQGAGWNRCRHAEGEG